MDLTEEKKKENYPRAKKAVRNGVGAFLPNVEEEDNVSPLACLARVIKASVEAGFVGGEMLLILEEAFAYPLPSAAAAANSSAIITNTSDRSGSTTELTSTSDTEGDVTSLIGEDMWEALARRCWPECADLFLTEASGSKMTTYRDLFTSSVTSDGMNGGWFEKVCANIGPDRSVLEYVASSAQCFGDMAAGNTSQQNNKRMKDVLAVLVALLKGTASVSGDHFWRAMITMGVLPNLVMLLKNTVPVDLRGYSLELLFWAPVDFAEDIVNAGAIPSLVDLLGSASDNRAQTFFLGLLIAIAATGSELRLNLVRSGILDAMVRFIEQKKSLNQDAPTEGLLLPDAGRGLLRWSYLLRLLAFTPFSPDRASSKAVIQCITSLVGEPLLSLPADSAVSEAVDNMIIAVEYFCSTCNKSEKDAQEFRNAFFDAGVVGHLVEMIKEGADEGVSEDRLYAALHTISIYFVESDTHKQAIIDAGFLDSTVPFLEGEHREDVKAATCSILCALARSTRLYFDASLCEKLAIAALRADGKIEHELVHFFDLLLNSCIVQAMSAKKLGSRLMNLMLLKVKEPVDAPDVESLLSNLIDKGLIELLLIKLDSSNNNVVANALFSIWCLLLSRLAESDCRISGSQIAALEWHESKVIRDMSTKIVNRFYTELSWEIIDARAKRKGKFRIFMLMACIRNPRVFLVVKGCCVGLVCLVYGIYFYLIFEYVYGSVVADSKSFFMYMS